MILIQWKLKESMTSSNMPCSGHLLCCNEFKSLMASGPLGIVRKEQKKQNCTQYNLPEITVFMQIKKI